MLTQDALAASQKTVALCRASAKAAPSRVPDVAQALTQFSICLSKAGRFDEALAAAQEAVSLYRAIKDEHLPEFGSALTCLGNRLSTLSRPQEALTVSQEAVRVWRILVDDHSEYLPDLAIQESAQSFRRGRQHLSNIGC